MSHIKEILLSTPQLSIITGPVNSGKTILLENTCKQLSNESSLPMPIYHINLRKGSFHSVESLVTSMSHEMDSWIMKMIRRIDFIGVINITRLLLLFLRKNSPIYNFNKLLERMANAMRPTTLLKGPQCPILYIDEANRLQTILDDKDGQEALKSLFEWLIMHTKEKKHFHVVLASSDSFFHLWVERFVGPSRYQSYVLGHLNKTEAERYWNKLLEKNENLLKSITYPKFEKAYSICGGSIFLLNTFMKEWCEE